MTWDIYTKEGKWLGHCDNLETKEHMEIFRDCECRERTVEDEIVNMMSPWDMSGNEGDISWSVVYVGDFKEDWKFTITVTNENGNKKEGNYELQRKPVFGLDMGDTYEINKILDKLIEEVK